MGRVSCWTRPIGWWILQSKKLSPTKRLRLVKCRSMALEGGRNFYTVSKGPTSPMPTLDLRQRSSMRGVVKCCFASSWYERAIYLHKASVGLGLVIESLRASQRDKQRGLYKKYYRSLKRLAHLVRRLQSWVLAWVAKTVWKARFRHVTDNPTPCIIIKI